MKRCRNINYLVVSFIMGWSAMVSAQEATRPHAYIFSDPELVSTQRVFGLGHAVVLMNEECQAFPEAVASYKEWNAKNGPLLQSMTESLAKYYRIPLSDNELQNRVAAAMHLKTTLDLSKSKREEVCPTLSETLTLPTMDLKKRYESSMLEVKDPKYFDMKHPAVQPAQAPTVTE